MAFVPFSFPPRERTVIYVGSPASAQGRKGPIGGGGRGVHRATEVKKGPSWREASFTMHMLVTGGAGFIGSHISESLLARGDTVVALDDLSTGTTRNVEALRSHPRFDLVGGSVLDRDVVDELVAAADTVLHLAS